MLFRGVWLAGNPSLTEVYILPGRPLASYFLPPALTLTHLQVDGIRRAVQLLCQAPDHLSASTTTRISLLELRVARDCVIHDLLRNVFHVVAFIHKCNNAENAQCVKFHMKIDWESFTGAELKSIKYNHYSAEAFPPLLSLWWCL